MPHFLRFALIFVACCAVSISAAAKKPSKKRAPPAIEASAPAESQLYASRPDAMLFADDLAERRDLDPAWVRAVIGRARFLPQVPRLMLPAPRGTAKNWRAYRGRFVEPVRIRAGVRFWNENAAALARAEQEYGVPQEIIVGILGVETLYGQHMGNIRVLDALTTLAFDFPSVHPRAAERQAYFRGELEQFLSLAHRSSTDPFEPRGSYAGAMGLGQFMPSSWARWAVDFDRDGHIDLFGSAEDAIGSVASYFIGHGWQPGLTTHFPVRFDDTRLDLDALLAPDILPSFSVASMAAKGALVEGAGAAYGGKLALIELQNGGDAPTFVAGTDNFYAVTRYNWSSYYAMAVIELGQAVAAARGSESLRGQ
ncbi:MAG: lytic murein transglycosylase B [Giesbergeria sp.]